MHEGSATLWLCAAGLCAFTGMGWLALAMPVHAAQAWGRPPPVPRLERLRLLGAAAVLLALACCLGSDHATMAVLVWVMLLAAASVATAMLLSCRPRCLRMLAPWIRRGGLPRAGG